MTEQDTFIHDNSEFWHRLIWDKLEEWNGDFKLKLKCNTATFCIQKHRWSLKIMNFIDTQNADRYGKVYVPKLNEWIGFRELLESITVPRKVE